MYLGTTASVGGESVRKHVSKYHNSPSSIMTERSTRSEEGEKSSTLIHRRRKGENETRLPFKSGVTSAVQQYVKNWK